MSKTLHVLSIKETKLVEIENNQRYYEEMEMPGYGIIAGPGDEIECKRNIYEIFEIQQAVHRYVERTYYAIDIKDTKDSVLLIKEVIKKSTDWYVQRFINDKNFIDILKKEIQYLKRPWWYRLFVSYDKFRDNK